MDTSDLAKRMKKYEHVTRTHLITRMPVIIRIDGKAFHTFTRGFDRPFDEILIRAMQETMMYLCQNIQGCVLGYTQSDEITLVLVDYKKFTSNAWFDYNIQKCVSIAASMATMAFNRIFIDCIDNAYHKEQDSLLSEFSWMNLDEQEREIFNLQRKFDVYYSVAGKAMFDARVFNLPKEEVTNNIYWRQLDASRNSIQMVGQAYFSHKELQNKSCNEIQDMLMTQKGINWNDFFVYQKRGSCCVRNRVIINQNRANGTVTARLRVLGAGENTWIIDRDIPKFSGDGRKYIDELIYVGEE